MDTNKEQIARLIPKRNVEIWISCLNGAAVDEQTDYKTGENAHGESIPSAAKTPFDWTRRNVALPMHCVDSLRRGVSELSKLGFPE